MLSTLVRIGAYVRALEGWRALLFAWLAGLLSALSFAPFGVFPLLLIAYAALVLVLDGANARPRRIRTSALIGWAFGFGQFLAGLYWVGYAFMVDPSAHAWQMPFAILFLTGGLALFPALACAVAGALWREHASRVFLLAASLAVTEWLRGHVFTGFPWNLAAYGWIASLGVLQSSALIGAYGLTLLTILFGASLAELVGQKLRPIVPAVLTGLFVVLWLGGDLRLATTKTETVPHVALRIVQPDVPQAEKYKRQFVLRNWERLLALSEEPSKVPITHLVWPEAAPPFFLQREPVAIDQVASLTQRGLTLITGMERYSANPDGDYDYYNSLAILGARARVLALYDKFHLVPFGEYVPFASLLSRFGVTKVTAGQAGFSSGDGLHTFPVPGAPPVGPLICYEILFPGQVVSAPRPSWFVNVTDDSWFGPSTGPYQHLAVARVRAIEEGIPVVRAANTGISAVIDPLGRTIAILPLNQMGDLDAALPAALGRTAYGRFGDLWFWLMAATSALTVLAYRRK